VKKLQSVDFSHQIQERLGCNKDPGKSIIRDANLKEGILHYESD